MVEILNGERVQFGTFDILTDEAVRQGLEEFSSWYAHTAHPLFGDAYPVDIPRSATSQPNS